MCAYKMEVQMEKNLLVLEEELSNNITVEEAEALKPIQKKFMESYLKKEKSLSVEEWLNSEMAENLPEYSENEISQMSNEIITTLKIQEEKKKSLEFNSKLDSIKRFEFESGTTLVALESLLYFLKKKHILNQI